MVFYENLTYVFMAHFMHPRSLCIVNMSLFNLKFRPKNCGLTRITGKTKPPLSLFDVLNIDTNRFERCTERYWEYNLSSESYWAGGMNWE